MKRAFAAAILSGLLSLCFFSQDGWAGPPGVVDSEPLPVENPTEWRKLKIINRNDPAYRPEKFGD